MVHWQISSTDISVVDTVQELLTHGGYGWVSNHGMSLVINFICNACPTLADYYSHAQRIFSHAYPQKTDAPRRMHCDGLCLVVLCFGEQDMDWCRNGTACHWLASD
jgi:hypothetical protein